MSSTVLNVATVDLIIEQALSQCSEYDKQYLQLHLANDKSSFLFESRGMTYTISNLSFSREGDATYSDIINTISLLENVTFLNCEFNGNKFYFLDSNQRNSGIHFQNCKFKNEFELKHHVVHENYKGGVFLPAPLISQL